MEVLFHTNRGVAPSDDTGFRAVAGWWGANVTNILGHWPVTGRYLRTNATRKLKHKWNLPQSLKYAWALNASSADEWLLVDTDTIFQCSADEIRARFAKLHAPLVVGTERWWFPQPRLSRGRAWRDPFGTACRSSKLKYPNSGMLMGTRKGFATLLRALHRQPGYPCCSTWSPAEECFVDDQACLQAALLTLRLATWQHDQEPASHAASLGGCGMRRNRSRPLHRRVMERPRQCHESTSRCSNELLRKNPLPTTLRVRTAGASLQHQQAASYVATDHTTGAVDYALDVQASLFLNLFMVKGNEMDINEHGQLTYRGAPDGVPIVPCIIHANAYKSPEMLRALFERWTNVTWVPARTTRVQRWLMARQVSRGINRTRTQ